MSRSSARPRIALFGLFGCGNFGNDGSLEAMLNFLRRTRPHAHLACICADPGLIQSKFGLPTLPIRGAYVPDILARGPGARFFRAVGKVLDLIFTIRTIRSFDIMIVPGTGILDDFGERPYGMPWDIFRWCLFARIFGVRLAFVSIGAGPVGNPISRWLMMSAAKFAHYRSYRDGISKQFMTTLGLNTRDDPVYPDIAFRLGLPTASPIVVDDDNLTIGIGVMSYYGWYGYAKGGAAIYERYITKLTEFVVHLLDEGRSVRILTGETTDAHAVVDLTERLRAIRPLIPPNRILIEPASSLNDLMKQIVGTDIVVATRFHNIVCALKMRKPAISLGYSQKNDVLMGEMGLRSFCQHVERFEVKTLICQLNTLIAGRQARERELGVQVQRFEKELENQEAFLCAQLI